MPGQEHVVPLHELGQLLPGHHLVLLGQLVHGYELIARGQRGLGCAVEWGGRVERGAVGGCSAGSEDTFTSGFLFLECCLLGSFSLECCLLGKGVLALYKVPPSLK